MALARVMLMSRGAVAPIARVAGARFMHASAALAADAAQDPADFEPLQLEDALANELNFEQNSAEGDNITKEEIDMDLKNAFPQFDGEILEGKTTVRLSRKMHGDMDVTVVVDLCTPEFAPSNAPEEEEPAEEDMSMALQGRMTVVKAASDTAVSFLFHVPTAAEAGVELLNVVTHGVTPELAASTTVAAEIPMDAYSPSNFDDLDFALQASFVKFLGDCGVDVEFAEAVRGVADRKEQFEYLRWLSRCHSALEGTARS